jgi:hypothetical protein
LERKRSLADIETSPRTRKAQESLDTALKKLGKLSLSIQHRREGDAAEKIARRVAAVFDAITTYGEDEKTWDKIAARQLGKLRATVKWEEQFDINSVPQRCAVGKKARAKRRQILVHIGNWNISLTTTTFRFRSEDSLHEMETLSTLRVEPRSLSSGSALAVFFSEHTGSRARTNMHTNILTYNQISNESEVFEAVEEDDLDKLLRLLAYGKASIRDCDEAGRSLIHVSSPSRYMWVR